MRVGAGSPGGILAMLGVLQWFDLLNRFKFSVYTNIYVFTRDWDDWVERPVPQAVLDELLASFILGPFWGVDMRVPHLDFIGATDAFDEFGMGGCVAGAYWQIVELCCQLRWLVQLCAEI